MAEKSAVPMTHEELTGQLLAVQYAIRRLITMSPDPEDAARALGDYLNEIQALGEPKLVPEDTLAGFARARGRMLPSDSDIQRFA